MKKPATLLLVLCTVALTGCGDSDKESAKVENNNVLYRGHRWDVVKVNDSIVVCLPGLDANSELVPVVINLHNPSYKTDSER